jgi:molecular chaperone DnaK
MRITPTSGLAPDEIDRLIGEAENYAEADRQTKERAVLHNKLDSLLRNTQKSFTKFGGLLSENDQDIAERIFAEAEEAVKSGDPEAVDKTLTGLERIAGQLTTAMMNPLNEPVVEEAE